MNRRSLLTSAGLALIAQRLPLTGWISEAEAETASSVWRHGVSPIGDLKYPANFPHFDYVNVAAPKGGAARLITLGTFDNFNIVVAGIKGTLVQSAELLDDSIRLFQSKPLHRGVDCLLNKLFQRHLKAVHRRPRLCRFQAALLRRHRAPPVIELNFSRRFRNGLYHADAVLRVSNTHADVQSFNLHIGN